MFFVFILRFIMGMPLDSSSSDSELDEEEEEEEEEEDVSKVSVFTNCSFIQEYLGHFTWQPKR